MRLIFADIARDATGLDERVALRRPRYQIDAYGDVELVDLHTAKMIVAGHDVLVLSAAPRTYGEPKGHAVVIDLGAHHASRDLRLLFQEFTSRLFRVNPVVIERSSNAGIDEHGHLATGLLLHVVDVVEHDQSPTPDFSGVTIHDAILYATRNFLFVVEGHLAKSAVPGVPALADALGVTSILRSLGGEMHTLLPIADLPALVDTEVAGSLHIAVVVHASGVHHFAVAWFRHH